MAAEPGGEGRHAVAERREGNPSPALSAAAACPRKGVEQDGDRVAGGVQAPDAPVGAAQLGPVGEAGGGGRHGGEDAGRDEPVGGFFCALAAAEIEQQRSRPGADHDVRQRRVKRMAEPGPAEDVLAPRRRRHGGAHDVLQRLGDAVETVELLDPLGDRLADAGLHDPP